MALIDIGGGSTTVAVFEDGHLLATRVIPLGGENITKDISIGLRTSTDEAERVKKQFGHAFYEEASEEETFEVAVIGFYNVCHFPLSKGLLLVRPDHGDFKCFLFRRFFVESMSKLLFHPLSFVRGGLHGRS